MTESNEPNAREVEALAGAVLEVLQAEDSGSSSFHFQRSCPACWRAILHVARMILSRESRLVAALEQAEKWFVQIAGVSDLTLSQFTTQKDYGRDWRQKDAIEAVREVRTALAAHRAATQPSEPTLAPRYRLVHVPYVDKQRPWCVVDGPGHDALAVAYCLTEDAATIAMAALNALAREKERGK